MKKLVLSVGVIMGLMSCTNHSQSNTSSIEKPLIGMDKFHKNFITKYPNVLDNDITKKQFSDSIAPEFISFVNNGNLGIKTYEIKSVEKVSGVTTVHFETDWVNEKVRVDFFSIIPDSLGYKIKQGDRYMIDFSIKEQLKKFAFEKYTNHSYAVVYTPFPSVDLESYFNGDLNYSKIDAGVYLVNIKNIEKGF